MTIGEFKRIIYENDSKILEPLKLLFLFNDFLNDEYKKENDGKDSPFFIDNIKIEDIDI